MIIFLIAAMPLTYLIINSLFTIKDVRLKDIFLPFLLGMFIYVPAVLLYWTFNRHLKPGIGYLSMFFYSLFKGQIFTYFITAGLVLLFIWPGKFLKVTRVREIAGYLCGFFFLRSVHIALLKESWYGIDELFLTPLIYISCVLLVSVFLARFFLLTDNRRFLWIGFVAAVPFIANLPASFILYNWPFVSIVLSVLILAGSGFVFYMEMKRRLPGYPVFR